MRLITQRDGGDWLLRLMSATAGEVAYLALGLRGLALEFETPSQWHENRRAWVRFGFGLGRLAFSFPWRKVAPDYHQCSGPTYGFHFFEDVLFVRWGQDTGRSTDRKHSRTFTMPWGWRHRLHEVLSDPITHEFRYTLKSGEVQERQATIKEERRTWTRPWLPWKQVGHYIDIQFDNEVGEKTGSWKGGVIGCSFTINPGETPLEALRRAETEMKL